MTHTRYAFIKANWHSDIVDQSLVGFREIVGQAPVDVFDVPGAFEMPLIAKKLAASGKYAAIAAAAFVVDGGIYRHEFVAQTVVDGLMQVGLETGIPVLSVSLTPQSYQETAHHDAVFSDHFIEKGREAGRAAIAIAALHQELDQAGAAAHSLAS